MIVCNLYIDTHFGLLGYEQDEQDLNIRENSVIIVIVICYLIIAKVVNRYT